MAVDWLAFYQPASFGKSHQWRIEEVAPVLAHELTVHDEERDVLWQALRERALQS